MTGITTEIKRLKAIRDYLFELDDNTYFMDNYDVTKITVEDVKTEMLTRQQAGSQLSKVEFTRDDLLETNVIDRITFLRELSMAIILLQAVVGE